MGASVQLRSGGPLLRSRAGAAVLAWSATVTPPPSGGGAYEGSHPSDIAGLVGWWDASGPANLLTSSGLPASGFGIASTSLTNKVSGGLAMTLPTSSTNGAQSPTGAVAIARTVGIEGAVGATLNPFYGLLAPLIDTTINPVVSGLAVGSGTARTIHFVWSRPNRLAMPFDGYAAGPFVLLEASGTPILTVTNTGAGDTITLFTGTVLTTSLSKRHTHSVTLLWAANGTVTAYLDDTQVATGIANPLASSVSGLMIGIGNAGCYLHELDVWDHALTGADLVTLLSSSTSVSKRWARGSRAGQILIAIGQSNQEFFMSDAEAQFQEAARYHLGSLSVNALDGGNRTPGLADGTIFGGSPLYDTSGTLYLTDPGTGAPPSTWALGNNGNTTMAAIASMSASDRADVAGIWWYFSENDSSNHDYTALSVYQACVETFIARLRVAFGKTAAQVPMLDANALPYGGQPWPIVTTATGVNMIRAAIADAVTDVTQNIAVVVPNTSACFGRGAAPDGSGGDTGHLDAPDNVFHAQLSGPLIARALIASGAGDVGAAVPTGIQAVGGPVIVSATVQSSTTILVTIRHDCGTDIVLPGNAPNGAGWTIFDGYAGVMTPGTEIAVSSVARVSATTALLTLAAAMTNSPPSCQLFYPWGSSKIGRGWALTDNYSVVTKPTGFDIGADLGASYAPNYPLAVPPFGITLT